MPYYVNTATIGGYLVGDPELKYAGSGKPVTNFTVALNKPGRDRPDYISCVAWGDQAQAISMYGKRGQEISVTGDLESNTWKDKHGTNHTTTKVVVGRFNLGAMPRSSEISIRRPKPPVLAEPRVER